MNEGTGEQLPTGWVTTPLAAIVEPRSGKASPQATPDAKFVGMEQVEAHTMRLLGTVPAGSMKSGANAFQPGDVLYGRLRSYLNKVYQPNFEGLCSGEFIVLPESSAVLGKFLKYRLNAGDFVRFASRINTGDRPRVDFDQIKVFDLLLPPRPEQERIADALEELFSDLEAALAALERVRAELKLYRAALLKATVDGALTSDWRTKHPRTESASELLNRTLVERRRRWEDDQLEKFKAKGQVPPKNWKAKYREPVVPNTTNLTTLPEGWNYVNIETLVQPLSNAIRRGPFGSALRKEIFVQSGYRVYEQQHAIRGDFNIGSYFINEDKYKELSSFHVSPGDLIISCSGTIGRVAVVPVDAKPGVINQALLKLSLDPGVVATSFFLLAFEYRLRSLSARGTGMANLSGIEDLKKMAFPLPPLAEQEAIINVVEDCFSVVEHLEANLDANLKSARSLRQSILHHAFTGQLVPQDPNDEPAPELLRRIAAEREARAHQVIAAKKRSKETTGSRPRPIRRRKKKTKDD